MTKTKYLVYSIDSISDTLCEPHLIKCLRVMDGMRSQVAEIYEYTSDRKYSFICFATIKTINGQKTIEITPRYGQVSSFVSSTYQALRERLIKRRVRGEYRTNPEKPFAFVLKEMDKIEI